MMTRNAHDPWRSPRLLLKSGTDVGQLLRSVTINSASLPFRLGAKESLQDICWVGGEIGEPWAKLAFRHDLQKTPLAAAP